MRLLVKLFNFLKQGAQELAVPTLQQLGRLLPIVAANPSNPVFIHNLFEAIAGIIRIAVPQQTDAVEGVLVPVCAQVLEQNVADFLPYTFQILGLLLDATSDPKPLYRNLFERLLTEDLWRAQANIPGLVRILQAYFAKHTIFGDVLSKSMQGILERFQFIL